MSRLAFFLGLVIVAVLIASLYRAKSGAKSAEAEIVEVEQRIAQAEEELTLLEAEFAHLSRRDWIEEYARTELGMGPAKAAQIAREADLDSLLGPPTEADDGRVPREEGAAQ